LIKRRYLTTDNQFRVVIASDVFDAIIKQCEKSTGNETGGILIGHYSNSQKTAIITSATAPTVDTIMCPTSFFRGKQGLKTILDNLWDSGDYYVGEWHYHPFASSKPSNQDIRQMIDFSKNDKLKCPEPILIVIGGDSYNGWEDSLRVFYLGNVISLKEDDFEK
jgi:integrative and conjugative element protein (TIGR02256 family)